MLNMKQLLLYLSFYIYIFVITECVISPQKREGTKLCGRDLSTAMHMVCGGFYNTLYEVQKKSIGDYADYESNDYMSDEPSFPFRSKEKAFNIVPRYRLKLSRTKRWGIADECCRKGCTVEEMALYCAPRA